MVFLKLRTETRFSVALFVAVITLVAVAFQSKVPYFILVVAFSILFNIGSGLEISIVVLRTVIECIIAMILYTVISVCLLFIVSYLGDGFLGALL